MKYRSKDPIFVRFDNLEKASLTRYMLDVEIMNGKKEMPFSQNVGGILILLMPLLVFFVLPRIGFSPSFLVKILVIVALWLVCGMIMALIDKQMKKRYGLKFEEAARYFIESAMQGGDIKEAGLAAIKVWSAEHDKDFFHGVIRRHCRNYADEKLLSADEIIKYEKGFRELRKLENEGLEAQLKAKLADKEKLREEIRSRAYQRGAFPGGFDQNRLREELQPVVEEMSYFQLLLSRGETQVGKIPSCVTGNLHMAVSPDSLILLEANPKEIATGPDRASFLLQNKRATLYIIPASFIKKLDFDRFIGRLQLSLHEALPRIVIAKKSSFTNPKNHKQLITQSVKEHFKNLHMDLDKAQQMAFGSKLLELSSKVSILPECPICKEHSQMQRTGPQDAPTGFVCIVCATRYVWGVDYLRRIIVLPTPGNQKKNVSSQLV